MWQNYHSVTSIAEVLHILNEEQEGARIIAGGTDLLLEIERKVRTGIVTLIDVSRIPGLDEIRLDSGGQIHLGPLVTHSHCVASPLIWEKALPLAQAALEVGAPQIRNRGTVSGNLITASPANDTIPALMALDARVSLRSPSGERQLSLEDFYTGVRKTVMRPDEMLVDISFPALEVQQAGRFIKLGLRRAQAISVVNAAAVLTFSAPPGQNPSQQLIEKASLTLGAVAPTIIRAREAENFLVGRSLNAETIETAARLCEQSARPIDDVRASADYRREMVRVCSLRALRSIAAGERQEPARTVLLWGRDYRGRAPELGQSAFHQAEEGRDGNPPKSAAESGEPIATCINGRDYVIAGAQHKTLLRLLREDAGLTGTKEGCAEGECGACTVFLDGMAVMSCLVPAPRAHGSQIVTIEGLAHAGGLHPVQWSFIDVGAVQCGYCTPGFIMSAAKLLEEIPDPSREEIQQALTGNLCRCTGYYKILTAIERASQREVSRGQV